MLSLLMIHGAANFLGQFFMDLNETTVLRRKWTELNKIRGGHRPINIGASLAVSNKKLCYRNEDSMSVDVGISR